MINRKLDKILARVGYFNNRECLFKDLQRISVRERKLLKSSIESAEVSYKPSDYLYLHDLAWRIHNGYDETLMSDQDCLASLSTFPEGVESLFKLYSLDVGIDRLKRIFCNGLKGNLETFASRKSLSLEGERVLFTPLEISFYIQYGRDLVLGDFKYLTKRYFRGSESLAREEIARSRRPLNVKSLFLDNEDLNRRILLHKKVELAARLQDDTEVFAVNQLLQRDNFEEYLYRKSLVGVGDIYLHQLVSKITGLPMEDYDAKIRALEGLVNGTNNKIKDSLMPEYEHYLGELRDLQGTMERLQRAP